LIAGRQRGLHGIQRRIRSDKIRLQSGIFGGQYVRCIQSDQVAFENLDLVLSIATDVAAAALLSMGQIGSTNPI
jgi:hypothetical protein